MNVWLQFNNYYMCNSVYCMYVCVPAYVCVGWGGAGVCVCVCVWGGGSMHEGAVRLINRSVLHIYDYV